MLHLQALALDRSLPGLTTDMVVGMLTACPKLQADKLDCGHKNQRFLRALAEMRPGTERLDLTSFETMTAAGWETVVGGFPKLRSLKLSVHLTWDTLGGNGDDR